MKLNKKLMLSTIGLTSISLLVPTILTSCKEQNEKDPENTNPPSGDDKSFEFIDFDKYQTSEGDDGITYSFGGALNDTWLNKSSKQVIDDLGLTLDESSKKDASNNNFKNLEMFKSVMNIGTLYSHDLLPEEININFEIQKNSFLNSYHVDNQDKFVPLWLKPSEIKYESIFDKVSIFASLHFDTDEKGKEYYYLGFIFNYDHKYTWDNGTDYSITFSFITYAS